jgi:hypothetical protein
MGSPAPDTSVALSALPVVPAPLAEYAERLLLSTGLGAEDALRIASSQLEPPEELADVARALRAGWDLVEDQA